MVSNNNETNRNTTITHHFGDLETYTRVIILLHIITRVYLNIETNISVFPECEFNFEYSNNSFIVSCTQQHSTTKRYKSDIILVKNESRTAVAGTIIPIC